MSGEASGRHARPMHVTEEELRELAGSGEGRAAVVARLLELVPSGAEGELRSDQAGPVAVDRSELEALRRDGERPEGLAERLAAASAPDRPDVAPGPAPEGPTRTPPQATEGAGGR